MALTYEKLLEISRQWEPIPRIEVIRSPHMKADTITKVPAVDAKKFGHAIPERWFCNDRMWYELQKIHFESVKDGELFISSIVFIYDKETKW